MTDFDAIATVEALYRTDLGRAEWLAAVMKRFQPLMDPNRHGLFGGFYDCPDPLSFVPEPILALESGEQLLSVFYEGLGALSEEFVAGAFLSPGIVRGTEVEGWAKIPPVREGALRALGFVDNRSAVAIEPDGRGCRLTTFHATPAALGAQERALFSTLFRHFVAAHRLHRRLKGRATSPDLADAVLDSSGRIHHARGAATNPLQRASLRRAVIRSEQARGRRSRRDPIEALSAWESLVMGRWTFVDHFDRGGRRYVLVHENAPRTPGFDLLSVREREVVERALSGSDNKSIAYDLDLSHSTVRVLMSRAALKLGVHTRGAVLAKARAALGQSAASHLAANV